MTKVFEELLTAYGPQHWWPAESRFEVMVGAILTQNTHWKNVEKAIQQLKLNSAMSPQRMVSMNVESLAQMIYSAGFFNVKAGRLLHFCQWYLRVGGYECLQERTTDALRRDLLSVHGIGPETADDILLYAFDRPVFVIDTYTRRLFSTLGMIKGKEAYEDLRHWFEASLPPEYQLYNEYHALIVRHAKEKCLNRAHCTHCLIEQLPLHSIN